MKFTRMTMAGGAGVGNRRPVVKARVRMARRLRSGSEARSGEAWRRISATGNSAYQAAPIARSIGDHGALGYHAGRNRRHRGVAPKRNVMSRQRHKRSGAERREAAKAENRQSRRLIDGVGGRRELIGLAQRQGPSKVARRRRSPPPMQRD